MNVPYRGRFKVTQIYKGSTHKGLDLVGLDDKTIFSPVIGVIEAVRWDTHPTGGMGLYVRIREEKNDRRHYLAHLSEVYVKEGDLALVGTKIGKEGNTGNSFGSHCHYEIRRTTNNTTFLDVSVISGIPNELGTYRSESLTKEEAKAVVKEAADLSEATIQYIADDYRWGDVLIVKLADAIQGVSK